MKETFDLVISNLYDYNMLEKIDESDIDDLIRLMIIEEGNLLPSQKIENEFIYEIANWMEYQNQDDSYDFMNKMKENMVKKYYPILLDKIEEYKKYMQDLNELEKTNLIHESNYFNRQRI